MVNTGKPSGGCKLCRARRIKCDEGKPACQKCIRIKKPCPGYRDPFDGKIRDETQSTIRKFKRTRIVIEKEQVLREQGLRDDGGEADDAEANADADEMEDVRADVEDWSSGYFYRRKRSTTPLSASSTGSFDSIHHDYITTLATPTEQRATCYLLSDYVLVTDSPGGRRGYYKFAYKMLTRPTRPSRCLLSAFKAVSFVALASRPGAAHLVIDAESHYSRALREVNAAIQDPRQVKHDDTLAAVLLLAFYETLSSTREHLDEYVSHIKGAAQLVRMRGPKQHDTEEGAEMFSMTRNQFLSMRSLVPGPIPVSGTARGGGVGGDSDYAWLLQQSCPDAYVSRVATLTIACSEMRMRVDGALRGGGGYYRDPKAIRAVLDLLRAAQAISRKLSALDKPQGAAWQVRQMKKKTTTTTTKEKEKNNKEVKEEEEVQEDNDDENGVPSPYSFQSLYACMIYNIIWTSHLFLTTCILRCMAWLVAPDDWRAGPEYEAAVAATRRRVADIVASMDYACSWNGYGEAGAADFPCGMAPSAPSPSVSTGGSSAGQHAKGVAGLCVYRPAFTAMMSDYATPEQKRYLEGWLRFLADEVGIKQVNVLLKLKDQAAHPSKDIERDRPLGL